MPSPVGHTLIGLAIFLRFKPAEWRLSWREIVLVGLLATLPDFDFLPGFLAGKPNLFHRGVSHSLGLCVILSIVILLFELRSREGAPRLFLWFFLLYSSHIFADYFGADSRLPFGQPIFWPFSEEYLLFDYPIFLDIQRSPELSKFLPSLLSSHNLNAILTEMTVGTLTIAALNLTKIWRLYRARINVLR